jgi:hypothetical protein
MTAVRLVLLVLLVGYFAVQWRLQPAPVAVAAPVEKTVLDGVKPLVLTPAAPVVSSCPARVRRAAFSDGLGVGPVWFVQVDGNFERFDLRWPGGYVSTFRDDRASGQYVVRVSPSALGPFSVQFVGCDAVRVSDSRW